MKLPDMTELALKALDDIKTNHPTVLISKNKYDLFLLGWHLGFCEAKVDSVREAIEKISTTEIKNGSTENKQI